MFGLERKAIENIITRSLGGQEMNSQGLLILNLFNRTELKNKGPLEWNFGN